MRVKLFTVKESDSGLKSYYISIVLHHIAFDGWSTDIFIREVLNNYNYHQSLAAGDTVAARQFRLPEMSVQYKDFTLWQRNHISGTILNNQLAYWKEQLSDYQTLNLPADSLR